MVVTTNVKDHFKNKVGRLTPVKPGKRVVVSCSVCSTLRTKFSGIMFIVHGSLRGSFGRVVNGHVRGRMRMTCTFRRLSSVPRGFDKGFAKEAGP